MSPIRFEGPIKVLRMFSRGVESRPTGSCGIEVEAVGNGVGSPIESLKLFK